MATNSHHAVVRLLSHMVWDEAIVYLRRREAQISRRRDSKFNRGIGGGDSGLWRGVGVVLDSGGNIASGKFGAWAVVRAERSRIGSGCVMQDSRCGMH